MLALGLCILLNALLFVLFREFGRRGVSLTQAVPVNYAVCFACCFAADPFLFHEAVNVAPDWRWLALLQGALFIGLFILIGWAVSRAGIAYTTLMTKVSVVIPVAVAMLAFGESLTPLRGLGIGLALLAIVLLHVTPLRRPAADQPLAIPTLLLLGAVLFVGSGIVDTNFKLFDAWYRSLLSGYAFTAVVFGVAGVIGFAYLGVRLATGRERLSSRCLLAGILLGVPNYFTVYLLVLGLQQLPATVWFPASNIGQLLLGGLIGALVYREPIDRLGWLGLATAALAIVLIA